MTAPIIFFLLTNVSKKDMISQLNVTISKLFLIAGNYNFGMLSYVFYYTSLFTIFILKQAYMVKETTILL